MSKDNLPEEQTPRTEEAPPKTRRRRPPSLPRRGERRCGRKRGRYLRRNRGTGGRRTRPREKARRRSDTRKLRYGAMATGLSVIVIAAVVLLNVVVGILADRFPLTFDLTKDKTFSLSEQGAAVADSIQKGCPDHGVCG